MSHTVQEIVLREGDRLLLADGTELLVRRITSGRVSWEILEVEAPRPRQAWLPWPLRPALLRGH